MPKQTRHSTAYSGVYFVELADDDQSFFIRYKQNGKSFEERAGRSSKGWNAEKASFLRKERLSGVNPLGRCSWNISGQTDGENNWTFSVIFEAYLRLRSDLKGRENDVYRFRNYLREDFGDRSPSEVVPGDIERFKHKLQNQQLKPATVRHVLELLRRLANYAFKKKFCPGLGFKIKMPTVANQKTENLTKEQFETLLQVLDEEPDKQVSNIVRLVLYTGLRRGEIFSLKWNDIDFYGKTITIRSKKKEKFVELPMNEMAEKVLADHANAEAKSEFVFPGRGGRKRTECKRPLLRIKKNAGLPDDFRLLQGLRHVYASMLASSGEVDMETLQTLLTHKSSLMTQRYAHLREEALKNSDEKLYLEEIAISQIDFEEKSAADEEENTDQNRQVSHEIIVEENICSDELEESVIKNVSAEEGLKENQLEFISEDILESYESDKFEETVQAAGQSFEEESSEVSENDQNTEMTDQIELDDTDERLEENELLEDRLTSTEADYQEQETEYAEVDVDPIKMEVDMDEIVSAEELAELTGDLHVYETKAENKDSVYYKELTAETADVEKNMEGETEEVDYQHYFEENVGQDYSAETVVNSVFKEDLSTETEVEEKIFGIPEKKGDSLHAEKTPEDEILGEGIEVQTNDEQVMQYNYWENEETDSAEESGETIEGCKGEFSEQDDGTKINDFTGENTDSDYLDSKEQECKAAEIESYGFNQQEKETVHCIDEAEEETIASNADASLDDELKVEDSQGVQDFATEDNAGEEEIDNSEAASTKCENNVKISEKTEAINLFEQKSEKNNVFLSKTNQNSLKNNSLKDVKIDLEFKTENEASVINTDISSRSSISELKKELMSLSELIKSTPTKVKSSSGVQNP